MIEIESSGISDIGRKRKQNEDSFFYDDGMGLYVVADGMGGHNAGEVASKLVVETIRDYLKQDQNGVHFTGYRQNQWQSVQRGPQSTCRYTSIKPDCPSGCTEK